MLTDRSKLACTAGGPLMEIAPELRLLRRDEFVRMHSALADLPDKYRQVLELYYITGIAYRDIASDLDIPLATVKTHIRRAKVRLRASLVASPTGIARKTPIAALA